MFKRKTLFVVGAGASAEYKFPIGKELATQIGKLMDIRFEAINRFVGDGDAALYSEMTNRLTQDAQAYQNAAWRIRDGILLSRSIDDFIDLHRDDQYVVKYAKAAIVKAILAAERGSKLYFGPELANTAHQKFNPARFPDTWLIKFMQMLTPGIPFANMRKVFDNVSFIVFNYDRCIEFFLLNALQRAYSINEQLAAEIVSGLDIIHPYGAISNDVPFGANGSPLKLSQGIKTYTEQIADTKMLGRLGDLVDRADAIVYLGFAYHDQNIALVRPSGPMAPKPIFGTAFGMSGSDVEEVKKQLLGWVIADQRPNAVFNLENLTCSGLFDEYAKSLTAARQ